MANLKFWQTKKFKELERQWYERLSDLGFKDYEERLEGASVLKQRASNSYRGMSQVEREARLLYYQLLSSGLSDESFNDDIERLVMERRANGTKIKEISQELKELDQRCHRHTIRKIIYKYEIKWGIKRRK